jgi:Fur family transcriptional regulator, ferric uptake regulator
MTSGLELLQKELKSAGYSMTSVRQTIFIALENNEPRTMQQIIKSVHNVDRASVYRNLSLFEKLGIVHRLVSGWKYKIELADKFHYHHHHITCTKCSNTTEIKEDNTLEQRIKILATSMGFKPTTHQLEINGICKNCQ